MVCQQVRSLWHWFHSQTLHPELVKKRNFQNQCAIARIGLQGNKIPTTDPFHQFQSSDHFISVHNFDESCCFVRELLNQILSDGAINLIGNAFDIDVVGEKIYELEMVSYQSPNKGTVVGVAKYKIKRLFSPTSFRFYVYFQRFLIVQPLSTDGAKTLSINLFRL